MFQEIFDESKSMQEKSTAMLAMGIVVDIGLLQGKRSRGKKYAEECFKWVLARKKGECSVPVHVTAMYKYASSLIGTEYGKVKAVEIYKKLLYRKKYSSALCKDYKHPSIYALISSLVYLGKQKEAKAVYTKHYGSNKQPDNVYYRLSTKRITETKNKSESQEKGQ